MAQKTLEEDITNSAERAAIAILRDAKLETDEDYKNLVRLLDENGESFTRSFTENERHADDEG